jgi:hypothetical protein
MRIKVLRVNGASFRCAMPFRTRPPSTPPFNRDGRILALDYRQGRAMAHHVNWLILRVGHQQSIGPDALRALWASACQSLDVSVARQKRFLDGIQTTTYSLSAPPTLRDPREVELRMRRLLDDAHYLFTLSNVHH